MDKDEFETTRYANIFAVTEQTVNFHGLTREIKREELLNKMTTKVTAPIKKHNRGIKLMNSILLWVLFTIIVTIVIYVIVNEPKSVNDFIKKIF